MLKFIYKIELIFCFVCFVSSIHSQLPNTNIYHFEFKLEDDSLILLKANFLTDFNEAGYNNQPSFLDDDKVLITSNWKNQEQTDIYILDLKKEEVLRITATEESEYSPTLMPDKEHFTVVRVETNEKSSQVLWKYPLDRSHSGYLLLRNLRDVGYYKWIDDTHLAIFHVGNPNWLDIWNLETGNVIRVSDNAGRTFITRDHRLYYIYKLSDQFWQLKYYDLRLNKSVMVLQSLEGQEDFAMTRDGHFLMGKDSSLYLFRMGIDPNWKKIIDLQPYGIERITRMQIHENQLLVVSSKL